MLVNHRPVAAKSETGVHLCVLETGQEYCPSEPGKGSQGNRILAKTARQCRQSAHDSTLDLGSPQVAKAQVEGQSWLGSQQLLCKEEGRPANRRLM